MNNFNQNNFKANLQETDFSKIGVITLSTDLTIEQDYRKVCCNLPIDLSLIHISEPTRPY